jgi:hypothetical protein
VKANSSRWAGGTVFNCESGGAQIATGSSITLLYYAKLAVGLR